MSVKTTVQIRLHLRLSTVNLYIVPVYQETTNVFSITRTVVTQQTLQRSAFSFCCCFSKFKVVMTTLQGSATSLKMRAAD